MITSVVRPILCVVAAGAMLAVVACSSSDEPGFDTAGDDAGTSKIPPATTPSDDAGGPVDAGNDAKLDANVDAAARTCSDDHFCHSVLPADQKLHGVWGDGTGVVWAVSLGGSVLRWDGSAWAVHTKDLGQLNAIWGSGPTDIWIAGAQGVLHGTGASSSAITFAPVTLPGDPTQVITSVWGTGPNDIWAVGGLLNNMMWPWSGAGRVLHYTGPSGGWAIDDVSTQPYAFASVWGTSDGTVWVQGAGYAPTGFGQAQVYRRKAGAAAFEPIDVPPDPNGSYAPGAASFAASGASTSASIWLTGTTGEYQSGFWHGTSADNGNTYTWTFKALGFGAIGPNAVWGLGANDTWGVGEAGHLAHWDGTKWQQAAIRVTDLPVTKDLWAIWGKSSDDFWVVGDDIALHKTNGTAP